MKPETLTVCIKMMTEQTVDDLVDSVDDEAMKAKFKRILPKAEADKIRSTVKMDCVEVIKKPTIIANLTNQRSK